MPLPNGICFELGRNYFKASEQKLVQFAGEGNLFPEHPYKSSAEESLALPETS